MGDHATFYGLSATTPNWIIPISVMHGTSTMSDEESGESEERSRHHQAPDNEKCFWRQDPLESFSDWKVDVVANGKAVSTQKRAGHDKENRRPSSYTYHIHRCMIARGPRKSRYFARMFLSRAPSGKTRLDLEPLAAFAFPCVLDYVYDTKNQVDINTESATALLHLGELLKIDQLICDVKQFCRKDISHATSGIYYQHANLLGNKTVKALLDEFLGQNISDSSFPSPMVDFLLLSVKNSKEALDNQSALVQSLQEAMCALMGKNEALEAALNVKTAMGTSSKYVNSPLRDRQVHLESPESLLSADLQRKKNAVAAKSRKSKKKKATNPFDLMACDYYLQGLLLSGSDPAIPTDIHTS